MRIRLLAVGYAVYWWRRIAWGWCLWVSCGPHSSILLMGVL